MADAGHGVILNISSDLGLIGPNQTLYEQPDRPPHEQDKKPVSYSVVKSGLLGLTRYLATYWADRGVRTNAICPGGVAENPPAEFLAKITKLIPMQRMARKDDYQGMVLLMCSDAGAYMNGSVVSVDGGRTCW
jgi:NAD(P)-dependent dehydrogenase (short-subunit alcohol dehydrogenase family)